MVDIASGSDVKKGTKMKKIVFLIPFLFLGGLLPGKTYLEENFNQVVLDGMAGDIPSSWIVYDDGNRVDAHFSYCNNAWNVVVDNGDQVAISPSWFTDANTRADRWLVSPAMDLTQARKPFLSFRARSFDKGETETFAVLVSKGATEKEAFSDTLLFVEGEPGIWTNHILDLEAYVGEKIRLAFLQRSMNRYALYLDDILVSDLATPRISLSGLQCPEMVGPGQGFVFSCLGRLLWNEEIRSCTISYHLEPVQQAGKGLQGKCGSLDFRKPETQESPVDWHTVDLVSDTVELQTPGTYMFRLWVSSMNGREDVVSDTLSGVVEVSDQGYFPRRTLLEIFSSSTCGGCAGANVQIREAYESVFDGPSAPFLSVVKYQMDFPIPGDPCVIAEGKERDDFYDVTSIPTMFVNGSLYGSDFSGISGNLPVRVEAEKERVSPIEIEGYGKRTGTRFDVDVAVTNRIAMENLHLYVVLTEDSIYHEPQSNGETEFFHVARKVLPSAYGEVLDLASSGTREFHYSVDLGSGNPKIFGPWEGVSAVVFVQDTRSKEVLQSRSLRFVQESSSESLAERPDIRFNLSPNPCRERCRLEFGLPETSRVRVEILDLSSKVRKQLPAESMSAGTHVLELPVEGLEAGVYLLRIRVGQNVYVKKLVIC